MGILEPGQLHPLVVSQMFLNRVAVDCIKFRSGSHDWRLKGVVVATEFGRLPYYAADQLPKIGQYVD